MLLPSFTNTVTSKRLNKVNLSLNFRFGFLQNFTLHLFKHVKKHVSGAKKEELPRLPINLASASLHLSDGFQEDAEILREAELIPGSRVTCRGGLVGWLEFT